MNIFFGWVIWLEPSKEFLSKTREFHGKSTLSVSVHKLHRTTGGVLFVLLLIEGPFYPDSLKFLGQKKCKKIYVLRFFSPFGFLRKRFSKFSSWLGTSDKHWLHSFSILFIHAILVGVPSSWTERFRDTMWMIFRFCFRNFAGKLEELRFRVLVLSIIINRQATPELRRGNKWDHTFFNRWLAAERPLCLSKAFLHRFINGSVPILFREKLAKERKTWMVVVRTNDEPNRSFYLLAIFVLKSDSPKTKEKKLKMMISADDEVLTSSV